MNENSNEYEIPIVYLNEDAEGFFHEELDSLPHPPETFRDKANGE
jgi:hypothetical protein|tara:strand:+ start:195 stop:329 length:135 start_codon:yes stop_codon:yes gene_type:complete